MPGPRSIVARHAATRFVSALFVAGLFVAALFVAALFMSACDATDGSAGDPIPRSGPTTTTNSPTSTTSGGAGSNLAEVVRVIDGDTFEATIDGVTTPVRLIGINAPEAGECWADEATATLSNVLGSGTLRLERDRTDTDRYGRLLRYAWAGDVLVNEVMVAEGAAIARRFEPDTARAERLEAAQASARDRRLGLWDPGACGRADEGRLEFSAIDADPPGDDTLDLNGESVTLTNVGLEPVELGGWTVKDESSSHRYVFGPGTVVAPGASIVVRSGCGADTADEVFWCQTGSAIWNNRGDTAFLLDPSGNIAASRSYGRAAD